MGKYPMGNDPVDKDPLLPILVMFPINWQKNWKSGMIPSTISIFFHTLKVTGPKKQQVKAISASVVCASLFWSWQFYLATNLVEINSLGGETSIIDFESKKADLIQKLIIFEINDNFNISKYNFDPNKQLWPKKSFWP